MTSSLPPRTIARLVATAGVGAVCATVVSACADTDRPLPIMDTTWQITGVYTGTDHPPQLPDESAGRAIMVFGDGGIVGNTGCGQFRAQSKLFSTGGTDGRESWRLELAEKQFQEVTCQGAAEFFHREITAIMGADTFTVTRDGTRALVVKVDPGKDAPPEEQLTAPSLRLVAPGS